MNKVLISSEMVREGHFTQFRHGDLVLFSVMDYRDIKGRLVISGKDRKIVHIQQNIINGGSGIHGTGGYEFSWELDGSVTELRLLAYGGEANAFLKDKVIFNGPATVVYWENGGKTITKCSKDDKFDPKLGFLMAFFEKTTGFTKRHISRILGEVSELYGDAKAVKIRLYQRSIKFLEDNVSSENGTYLVSDLVLALSEHGRSARPFTEAIALVSGHEDATFIPVLKKTKPRAKIMEPKEEKTEKED